MTQQSQALATRGDTAALMALDDDREWKRLVARADTISRSTLVQKPLQGKPADVLAVLLACQDLDLPPNVTNVNAFHVIEGSPEPSAQLLLGMGHAAGYETEWGRNDNEVAELRVRRPGRPNWETFVFTIEDAQNAHLLDEWVQHWSRTQDGKNILQKWVSNCRAASPCRASTIEKPRWADEEMAKSGVQHKDNWYNYPADMLRARVAKRAMKAAAPEVRFGLVEHIQVQAPPEGRPQVVLTVDEEDAVDEVADAEIVEGEVVDGEPFEDETPAAAEPQESQVGTPPAELTLPAAKLELARAAEAAGLSELQGRALVEKLVREYKLKTPVQRQALDVALKEVQTQAESAMASQGETLFGGENG